MQLFEFSNQWHQNCEIFDYLAKYFFEGTMELMPIIKASLGIFTIISTTLFITAFLMYKIKSRNRVKPYERKPKLFDSSLILEIQDKTGEKIEIESGKHKFIVLNENKDYITAKNPQRLIHQNNNVVLTSPRKSLNEVFNIYNFYSDNTLMPMHKLRFNAIIAK
jgi:hypothetical protein